MTLAPSDPCPCGSSLLVEQCCLAYINGTADAPTAEALMRSRYTAYVLERFDYLRASWHPDFCPQNLGPQRGLRWLGLKVIRTDKGLQGDASGTVEFVARSKCDGRAQRQHEISEFERVNGRWVYCRGSVLPRA